MGIVKKKEKKRRNPLCWAFFVYFILELAIISKNKSVFFDNSIE